MLKYTNLFPRPELVRFSGFSTRECIFVSKFRGKASCLSCSGAVDLTGTKRLHSQLPITQKGFRDREFSSQVPELMDSNTMKEENEKNSHLPYDAAMEALSSLISSKKRGNRSAASNKYDKLDRMRMYLKIMGLEEHIAGLKIIHVAGTKGKGSTCAFGEAILRECGFRTGLFTSPHLIDVRERFRFDGLDISEDKFLHYFWECWHQLEENLADGFHMPPLFQFLTVLALKMFVSEKVDVAIIEVGLGGRRDSTNVINCPVVCGVTSLGMDHMESLGDTLQQIASHKAGIFKPQIPAYTVPQPSEAMDMLQEKAKEMTVPLQVVPPLNHRKLNGTRLSLSGDHQFTNAGLAVALCTSWLKSTGNWERLFKHAGTEDGLPEAFLRGLSSARLSGRAEIVYDSSSSPLDTEGVVRNSSGDLIFYLDGAHSPESLEACARWFSSAVKDFPDRSSFSSKNESGKLSKQILLFNCMDVRDPKILLPTLVDTCASSGTYFTKAIFVPSISKYNKVTSGYSAIPVEPSNDLSWQFKVQRIWETIIHGKDAHRKNFGMQIPEATPPGTFIPEDASRCSPANGQFTCSTVASSLPLAINWLRNYVKENPNYRIQVLVTGSLHLVGDVLKLLRRR